MNDFLLIFAWIVFSGLLRWAVQSGSQRARTVVGIAVMAGTITLLRFAHLSVGDSVKALALLAVLLGLGFWVSKYPMRLLLYTFRVLRGAAIHAKMKADKLAEVE